MKRVVRVKADDGLTSIRIEATINSTALTRGESETQARSVADAIVNGLRIVRFTDFDATNVRVK